MASTGTENHEYGQLLGELRSASQKVQIAVCLAGSVPFAFLWLAGDMSPLVMIVCVFAAIGLGHVLSTRLPMLRSIARIYENGISLDVRGKKTSFDYAALSGISCKHTHHMSKYGYVGTVFEWDFELEGKIKSIHYQGEYHQQKKTAETVSIAQQKSSEGVEKRLLNQLKADGELAWRYDVFLTHSGLKIIDGPNVEPREIRFDEIEDWTIKDNELKIFRRGDALPCFRLSNDTRNFIPMYGLFEKIAKRVRATQNSKTVKLETVPLQTGVGS